jgi:succinyl-diaminopimelate desuccinylase
VTATADFIHANRDRYERELFDFLRIPSVSADSRHKPDIRKACQFVFERLAEAGLKPEIIETSGNPMVYAESLGVPGKPTILIYGHYDVQPPDPLNLWTTGPFEPTVRDGNVYARGATDDKGQVYCHVKGLEAVLKTAGKLPINVKVLIEGEEEVGSKAIGEYLPTAVKKLACDYVVISDSSMFAPNRPAVTTGLRGLQYFEIFVDGPDRDLHSGVFGGSVQNPCNVICELLASVKGPDGRILIPGFYDDVVELTEREKAESRKLERTDAEYAAEVGASAVFGEKGYTTLERRSVRPTFDVHGLIGGYQGEGAKTVLPAKGAAKFSFRLVPNQNPAKIERLVVDYLTKRIPVGVKVEIRPHHGGEAVVTPIDGPGIAAASRALARAYGVEPVFIREGGSIPIVAAFKKHLGADSLLLGFGLNDDNTHSPNEKFHLADFHRGILTSAFLLEELAKG